MSKTTKTPETKKATKATVIVIEPAAPTIATIEEMLDVATEVLVEQVKLHQEVASQVEETLAHGEEVRENFDKNLERVREAREEGHAQDEAMRKRLAKLLPEGKARIAAAEAEVSETVPEAAPEANPTAEEAAETLQEDEALAQALADECAEQGAEAILEEEAARRYEASQKGEEVIPVELSPEEQALLTRYLEATKLLVKGASDALFQTLDKKGREKVATQVRRMFKAIGAEVPVLNMEHTKRSAQPKADVYRELILLRNEIAADLANGAQRGEGRRYVEVLQQALRVKANPPVLCMGFITQQIWEMVCDGRRLTTDEGFALTAALRMFAPWMDDETVGCLSPRDGCWELLKEISWHSSEALCRAIAPFQDGDSRPFEGFCASRQAVEQVLVEVAYGRKLIESICDLRGVPYPSFERESAPKSQAPVSNGPAIREAREVIMTNQTPAPEPQNPVVEPTEAPGSEERCIAAVEELLATIGEGLKKSLNEKQWKRLVSHFNFMLRHTGPEVPVMNMEQIKKSSQPKADAFRAAITLRNEWMVKAPIARTSVEALAYRDLLRLAFVAEVLPTLLNPGPLVQQAHDHLVSGRILGDDEVKSLYKAFALMRPWTDPEAPAKNFVELLEGILDDLAGITSPDLHRAMTGNGALRSFCETSSWKLAAELAFGRKLLESICTIWELPLPSFERKVETPTTETAPDAAGASPEAEPVKEESETPKQTKAQVVKETLEGAAKTAVDAVTGTYEWAEKLVRSIEARIESAVEESAEMKKIRLAFKAELPVYLEAVPQMSEAQLKTRRKGDKLSPEERQEGGLDRLLVPVSSLGAKIAEQMDRISSGGELKHVSTVRSIAILTAAAMNRASVTISVSRDDVGAMLDEEVEAGGFEELGVDRDLLERQLVELFEKLGDMDGISFEGATKVAEKLMKGDRLERLFGQCASMLLVDAFSKKVSTEATARLRDTKVVREANVEEYLKADEARKVELCRPLGSKKFNFSCQSLVMEDIVLLGMVWVHGLDRAASCTPGQVAKDLGVVGLAGALSGIKFGASAVASGIVPVWSYCQGLWAQVVDGYKGRNEDWGQKAAKNASSIYSGVVQATAVVEQGLDWLEAKVQPRDDDEAIARAARAAGRVAVKYAVKPAVVAGEVVATGIGAVMAGVGALVGVVGHWIGRALGAVAGFVSGILTRIFG
jgi:hypothetical protein